jgi:hypothetical protein
VPGVSDAHAAPHDHDHQHEHQAVPSDVALRVKALESLLVEKGMVDPAAIDATVDLTRTKSAPAKARGSSPGPGSIRHTGWEDYLERA